MIAIRYKKTEKGKYSVYLDIYENDTNGKGSRQYEFLKIHVSRDYSKSKRVADVDKEKMELVGGIRSKRELELYGTVQGMESMNRRTNISLVGYIRDDFQKTNRKGYRYFADHMKKCNAGKDVLFSDVTLPFLKKLQDFLSKKVSQNSMVYYMGILKKFMNKAYKEEIISFNPFVKYKMPPTQESSRVFLELHEVQALSNSPIRFEPQIRDAFLFSCFTGLRFSDIKTLTYSHLGHDKDKNGKQYPVLQLRPIKTTRTTGKILKVPLSEQALKILKDQKRKAGSDLVFYNLPCKNTCNNSLKKWAKEAGIEKNIHYHVSRHTFATLGLTSGIDIYTVSKLMGHTRLDATQIYAKVIDEKKRKEVDKFPVFSIKQTPNPKTV